MGSCCDNLGNTCFAIRVIAIDVLRSCWDSRYISKIRTAGFDDGLNLGQILKTLKGILAHAIVRVDIPFAKLRKNLERVLGAGVGVWKGGIKIYFRHVMLETSIKTTK